MCAGIEKDGRQRRSRPCHGDGERKTGGHVPGRRFDAELIFKRRCQEAETGTHMCCWVFDRAQRLLSVFFAQGTFSTVWALSFRVASRFGAS